VIARVADMSGLGISSSPGIARLISSGRTPGRAPVAEHKRVGGSGSGEDERGYTEDASQAAPL
jgi:hypothetical protein